MRDVLVSDNLVVFHSSWQDEISIMSEYLSEWDKLTKEHLGGNVQAKCKLVRWGSGARVQEAARDAIDFNRGHYARFLGRAGYERRQPCSGLAWGMRKATVEVYNCGVVCHVRNCQVWVDVSIHYAHFPPALRQAKLPPTSCQHLGKRAAHVGLETYWRSRESSCRNLCSQLESCEELSGSRGCRS